MGGINSGRYGGKSTTDDKLALDIRKLQRLGRLAPGQSFGWQWNSDGKSIANINISTDTYSVHLTYRHGGSTGQDMNYPVAIEWTPCNYGGQRAWWRCPGAGCGRRVAVLYGGKVFACRHCHQLNYASTRTAPGDKYFERAHKIRKRLGWGGGIASPQGGKPKGMHWKTYYRLLNQLYGHSDAAIQTTAGLVARLKSRLGR